MKLKATPEGALLLLALAVSCSRSRPNAQLELGQCDAAMNVLHQSDDPITCARVGAHSRLLAGTLSGKVLSWDRANGPETVVVASDKIVSVAFVGEDVIYKTRTSWRGIGDKRDWSPLLIWNGKGAQDTASDQSGRRIFAITDGQSIERLDFDTGITDFTFGKKQSRGKLESNYLSIHSIAVSADHRKLAVGWSTGASVIDVGQAKESHFFSMPGNARNFVAFSADARRLYVAGNCLRSWDAETGVMLHESLRTSYFTGLAVSRGGKIAIATDGGIDTTGKIELLTKDLVPHCNITAHLGPITFLSFREESEDLISAGVDGRIVEWRFGEMAGKDPQKFPADDK